MTKARIAIIFVGLSWIGCGVAEANFLSDVRGILTDPLKLDKSSQNLLELADRTAIHIERIEGQINSDAKDRLDQIDKTLRDTREFIANEVVVGANMADQFIDNAFNNINDLQNNFFQKTSDLVKCGTAVSADLVQSKIASSLNDLGLRKPRLTIFGWTVLEVKFDQQDFPSPIDAFRTLKKLTAKKLDEIREGDPYYRITDTYGEIARMADLTRCHYKEQSQLFAELYETELEYTRRGRSWVGRVNDLD